MAENLLASYVDNYSSRAVVVSPFTIKKMNLVPSAMTLKIDGYNLICTPYQLMMNKLVLLVFLSANESAFFQKYVKQLCTFNLVTQPRPDKPPVIMSLRCALTQLRALPGKSNASLIELAVKTVSNDLISFLGGYLTFEDSLKSQYRALAGNMINITPEVSKNIGYNNYSEAVFDNFKIPAHVKMISTDKMIIFVHRQSMTPGALQSCSELKPFRMKMFFKTHQFAVEVKPTALANSGDSEIRIDLNIPFCLELTEIIEYYLKHGGYLIYGHVQA